MMQGLLLLIPLVSFLFCALVGRLVGYKGVFLLSTISMITSSILSCKILYQLSNEPLGVSGVIINLGS